MPGEEGRSGNHPTWMRATQQLLLLAFVIFLLPLSTASAQPFEGRESSQEGGKSVRSNLTADDPGPPANKRSSRKEEAEGP